MDTQVSVSTVIAIVSALVSAIVGVVFALTRYAYGNDKKELERRIAGLEETAKKTGADLHADELATARLIGDVNLVKQNHQTVVGDIEEVKAKMVTKAEFDASMTNVNRQLERIFTQVSTQQRYPSTRGMERVVAGSDPPRKT